MLPIRYPSRDEARRYRHELRHALEALRGRFRPDADALAWPAGLDRGILLGLPLPDRTHRRLLQAGLMEGDSPLTVHEVVRIPNVSLVSMREALVAADAFLSECIDTFDDAPTPADIVAMRLRQEVKRLTPRERTIIEHRLLRRPPTTLAALGGMFAVSPSRILSLAGAHERENQNRSRKRNSVHRRGTGGRTRAQRRHGHGQSQSRRPLPERHWRNERVRQEVVKGGAKHCHRGHGGEVVRGVRISFGASGAGNAGRA